MRLPVDLSEVLSHRTRHLTLILLLVGSLATATAARNTRRSKVQLSLSPTSAGVDIGSQLQCEVKVKGTRNRSVRWSVNGIEGGNSSVGVISTSGLYNAPSEVPAPAKVIVTATSVADPAKSASSEITISDLDSSPVLPLAITTSSLPDGITGASYLLSFGASGGSPPYSWGLASGQLPPGLTLDEAGVVAGMPVSRGLYTFSVRVSDSSDVARVVTSSFTIDVESPDSTGNVLWSADMETGDTSQWYAPFKRSHRQFTVEESSTVEPVIRQPHRTILTMAAGR